MKIKFIGTGSGKTSLQRFHSSFIINSGNYNLLVDAGDGISKALLSAGVDINSISAVLFSHMHPDHSAGFPSFIIQLKMMKREEKLIIYCQDYLVKNIKELLRYTHIYLERLSFSLEFRTFGENIITDTGAGIKFKAGFNSHLDDLKEKYNDKFISCGFLFYLKNKIVFYTGDVGEERDLYLFGNEKKDIIIAECTHIDVNKIKEAFSKSGAEYLYLTHLDEDITTGSDKIIPVYDGFEVPI